MALPRLWQPDTLTQTNPNTESKHRWHKAAKIVANISTEEHKMDEPKPNAQLNHDAMKQALTILNFIANREADIDAGMARLREIVLLHLPEEAKNEVHHQLKRITVDNWKHVDDLIHFPVGVAEQRWVTACMTPQLQSQVPKEIVFMFEVARGGMVYGWFFYPNSNLAVRRRNRQKRIRLLSCFVAWCSGKNGAAKA